MKAPSTNAPQGRIAIIFANLKGNLGDFAILKAMLGEVHRHFGSREIDVFSHPLVGMDVKRLEDFKLRNPDVTFKHPPARPPVDRFGGIMARTWFRRWAQERLIRKFASDIAAEADRFAGYDEVLVAGGDQWSGRELGLFMFGTVHAIHRVNPNIRAFPFSLKSSILGLYDPVALRRHFNCIQQPIVVRDSLTKGIMDRVGVDSVLGADCVFSLAGSVDHIQPVPSRNHSRVLFVVKGQETALEAALHDLANCGIAIELLSTCPAEDDAVYGRLSRGMGLPYHVPQGWEGVIGEFRASSLVVTNRLHGLILGSLAGVPLLPVTDRKKALAFVKDADMPVSAPGPRDVSAALIGRALSDKELILERVRTYMDHCQRQPLSPFTPLQPIPP